jgi:hypothetical protein
MNRLVPRHSFATLATIQAKIFTYKDQFLAHSFNHHDTTAWFPAGIHCTNKHDKLMRRNESKGEWSWKQIGSGFLP